MGTTAEQGTEAATGVRRALLIGVRDTGILARHPRLAALYPPLECVDGDVRRIEEALLASEYEVRSFHPGHEQDDQRDTSQGMITQAMVDFLGECSPGDTAFVYVSSHGVTIDGSDYLLPSDARHSADGTLIAKTLVETTVTDLLGEVPAGVTVVVCLDTCRTESTGTAFRKNRTAAGDAYDNVVWLRASSRGQATFADRERGSYFGLALSEALSPAHPPQTLGEIKGFVQGRIGRLTRTMQGPPPTVELDPAPGREAWARELPLCSGSEETVRWARIVAESALWRHTSGSAEVHERVKEGLADLAAEVARSRVVSESPLDTPWHDETYPERVVHLLGRLVEDAGLDPADRLSPAETAALLAAPLLHEGVVAVALSELTRLRPDRLDRWNEDRGEDPVKDDDRLVCEAAADTCRAHSRVALAGEALRRRHLTDAATAADHWLRHRFIADWDGLWDRGNGYGAVHRLLDMVVTAVSAGADGARPEPRVVGQHVRRVLPHMTVAPGSGPRIDDTGTPHWSRDERPVPGNRWRDGELARLLWFAALLAADPRRMSSVLVDHLGAHRPLAPAEVVDRLAGLGWETVERDGTTGYALRLDCPHPALHAALEELVATADSSVRTLHRTARSEGKDVADLLRGVPRRVTADFLKPMDHSYTKPLERFRLAEDEIRPLLMGTQLYGDRMLAVRELYQNALDACRHRKLRVEYGRRRERYSGADGDPVIRFVQGYDGDRLYIECHDGGSGMSREKVTSMFARAGKRYEQDPEYVQERRNWRRVGMEPIPFNSRFGIGVFSYFMLAEEVTVSTAAIDQHGNLDRAVSPLQATVQSGSGLLQIRETATGPQLGGTVVRLYLSPEDAETESPSVVETLRRLLWVSDFPVTAEEQDRDGKVIRSEEWEPGVLQASEDRAFEWFGDPAPAGANWIVQGKGQLLLDGVVVENAPEVTGFVFNLRERHRPVPSVDRNSLLSYDRRAVEEEILAGIPEAAGALGEVSVPWLWDVATAEPWLLVHLFDVLPADTIGVLDSDPDDYRTFHSRIPVRGAGIFAIDRSHVTETRPTGDILQETWRLTSLGVERPSDSSLSFAHYPEPVGLDAMLVTPGAFIDGWHTAIRAAALAKTPLVRSIRALRRYAIAGVKVPAVRSITALREVGVPRSAMADLCRLYETAPRRTTSASPALHAPLLALAARRDMPPSALVPDLCALWNLGVEVPPPDVLATIDLQTKPPSWEVERLTSLGLDLDAWHPATVHPTDLLWRAPRPAQRRRLAERITAWEPLGFRLAPTVSERTLDHPPLTSMELRLLSRDVDGLPPWLPAGRLTMRQLVQRSAALRRPLGAVAREIADLEPATGVSVPEVPAQCLTWIPAPWSVQEEDSGPATASGDEAPLNSWRLIHDVERHRPSPSPEEFRGELTLLQACGLLADPVAVVVDQFEHMSPRLEDLLGRAFASYATELTPTHLGSEVPMPLLLEYAADVRTTMGAAVDELAQLDVRLPLRLPDLPEEVGSLVPHHFLVRHLVGSVRAQRDGSGTTLTHWDLLQATRSAYDTLGATIEAFEAFQPLGGPAVPGEATGPLAAFEPTSLDLVAFKADLLGSGRLGPLELVLVAGRFGWPLGETYDRYAPFGALGLDVTVPELLPEERETTPNWVDVVVLTEQLTGRAPALAGTVTPEHVVLLSEETEQTQEYVLDRLRRYARLFDLTLPDRPGGPRS
ncbi:caspase family protein [Streptomyces sp. NPDC007863]|uniref:HD domain-containing protein n=1 Tax=Streptomyces sp. NPDC007863 TaxID=3154894 RepID=UPI0033F0EA35